MSRIGYLPIKLPQGVEVTVSGTNLVAVKGAKGELKQQVDPVITVKVANNEVTFERPSEDPAHRSKHGLYRSLVNNMVIGVSTGYQKQLELVGVGFRANVQGQQLELTLGYSHNILLVVPDEVTIQAQQERGKKPIITLECIDKQLIGQVAAKIRSFRKPEPYKGKGILYLGEQIRRKAGKAAAATAQM